MRTETLKHFLTGIGLRFLRSAGAGWLMLLAFHGATLPAAEPVSKEIQLKAVCLWRLAQFVEWPTNAFESSESSLVIGVLGNNPILDTLKTVVEGETARGRKIEVTYCQRVDQIKKCHILFICNSEARRLKPILAELAGRPILTVSDIETFIRAYDGMICFLNEEKKIKLQIDPETAAHAGLVLDARLLRVAEIPKKK